MTKRYDEPIEVTTDPFEGVPLAFRWRERLYEVDQSLATWRAAGEWYSSNGALAPPDRVCYRLLAHPSGVLATGDLDAEGFMASTGAVYDIYLDPGHGWRLARLWD